MFSGAQAIQPGERHVLFRYTPTHDAKAVDRMLAGYQGYLVSDAHAVYDHLYAGGQVIEVGCWSHCRRCFFESLGSTDPERARTALAYLQGLFQIERRIAEFSRHERSTLRNRESRPLVEGFFAWCEAQAEQVVDDTPFAKGIRYARNQQQALARFLENGRASAAQQRLGARAAPRGDRKEELDLRGERPGGGGQRDLRLAARQLPDARPRAVELPAGKIIWSGVPAKGMVTWKGVPKPSTIHAVGSYIYTLRGTNPKNPKPREDQAPKQTGPSEFE